MLPLGPPSLIFIITCILVTITGQMLLSSKENLDMQLDRRGGLGPGGGGGRLSLLHASFA